MKNLFAITSTRFIMALFAAAFLGAAPAPNPEIRVDQVGYLSGFPKLAVVAGSSGDAVFQVKRLSDNHSVFSGSLSTPAPDPDSGDTIRTADFSAMDQTGEFYIEVPRLGRSWTFSVGPHAFARTFYLGMRSYYGQRCGAAVDLGPEFPGFRHAICHTEGDYHASSGKTGPAPNSGGWHDAGDYGRYVVNSGLSTGTLLWAYEMFADAIGPVRLNLPESGNGAPDILNEIRWNVNWMLSMQDADGGVWHKQTSTHFCAFILPEQDKLPSEVIGTGKAPFKSTCATADLAAVAAISARVYRKFDSQFAEKCLRAAKAAWTWTVSNPAVIFRNPPGVTTGEYGDAHCDDERFWAAAELWRTTGDPEYRDYFLANWRPFLASLRPDAPISWASVAPMGLWTYALAKRDGADPAAVRAIRDTSVDVANRIASRASHNGYHIGLTPPDYGWGSNGAAANYSMELLIVNAMAPDRRFVEAALENLHYLLGRNTFSLSFVTQVGSNSVRHPHHRPSGADTNTAPWPGLLAGGPNRRKQDPAMQSLPEGLPPARMYLDEQASYATNEVAINWNAPLVFVLAAANSLR